MNEKKILSKQGFTMESVNFSLVELNSSGVHSTFMLYAIIKIPIDFLTSFTCI